MIAFSDWEAAPFGLACSATPDSELRCGKSSLEALRLDLFNKIGRKEAENQVMGVRLGAGSREWTELLPDGIETGVEKRNISI
jgi:hypothetical protein